MKTLSEHVTIAESIVELLDNKFSLLGFRFGIDPIFNIFPGAGNVISAGLSCYIIWIAISFNIPRDIIMKMILNIGLDYLLGIVPIAGVFFDILFKANVKNLALLKQHLDKSSTGVLEGRVLDS